MERFFKIKKDYCIYKDYFEWWNNLEIQKEAWKKFKAMVGIESDYVAFNENLIFVPTENDVIKFGRFLCKGDLGNGAKQVKRTSTLQKDWINFIKNNNVKLLHKPNIVFDFPMGGRVRSRLFHYGEDLYCSVDVETNVEYEVPEGYEEIKGSEFYKIMEKIEES